MNKLISILLLSSALFADSITSTEASNYIGQEKIVCGKVVSTHYTRSSKGAPTFLNFDRPYPNQTFTVVIFKENRDNFRGAPENIYDNENICVTGLIETYKDSVEIVVSSDSQIK